MDKMSAIERLKDRWRRDAEYETVARRLALEQALKEEIDPAVWEEIQVEYDTDGRVSTIAVADHKPIRAMCHVGEDGIGWFLNFWVMRGDAPRLCQTFIDALILAEERDDRFARGD